ncbi:MAG: TlyA family RNA methyltransferase [Capsulimonadaceae bacterium]
MRLDRALVAAGLVKSRTEAQGLIAAGAVTVDGNPARKASLDVADSAGLRVSAPVCPYVSRGGLKLAAALDAFGVRVGGRRCLDIGASTGGFTDCLLQRGAAHVTAIDVGHGQMSTGLACDPRVSLREGVNARSLAPEDFDSPFDIVTADLSFISLTLVLPALAPLAGPEADFILLVKPQFEVGPAGVGKGGIVRSDSLREGAFDRVVLSANAAGLSLRGRISSPITGGDGNEEYLGWFTFQALRIVPP